MQRVALIARIRCQKIIPGLKKFTAGDNCGWHKKFSVLQAPYCVTRENYLPSKYVEATLILFVFFFLLHETNLCKHDFHLEYDASNLPRIMFARSFLHFAPIFNRVMARLHSNRTNQMRSTFCEKMKIRNFFTRKICY